MATTAVLERRAERLYDKGWETANSARRQKFFDQADALLRTAKETEYSAWLQRNYADVSRGELEKQAHLGSTRAEALYNLVCSLASKVDSDVRQDAYEALDRIYAAK